MNLKQITSFIALVALAVSSQLFAASNFQGPSRDANGKVVPTPRGEHCVEETSYMRANHMNLLLHKRDETVQKGIRTKKHRLTECIDCHVTPAEDGVTARISDEDSKHFCATCHIATAVTLDCFECHADRPVSSFKKTEKDKILDILSHIKPFKPHALINSQEGNL